jgi:hypothetical protein
MLSTYRFFLTVSMSSSRRSAISYTVKDSFSLNISKMNIEIVLTTRSVGFFYGLNYI